MTCKFAWVCYAMMLSLAAEGKHHPPPHSAALESSTIIIPTYDCKNTVQERKQKNGEVCQLFILIWNITVVHIIGKCITRMKDMSINLD